MKGVLNQEKGVTVLEGLVVLVITGLLLTFTARFYIHQNREYTLQEQISFLQKDIRLAMETLETEIRMAGSGFPKGVLASSIDIVDSDYGSDEITILQAVPGVECVLTETMSDPGADLECNDVSGFEQGLAVIADEVGSELFLITQVQEGSSCLQHSTMTFSRPYHRGSRVIQAQFRQFLIGRDSDAGDTETDHPRLLRREYDGTEHTIAEDIEDIQFSYILKDDSETTVLPANPDELFMVRVSITGRTPKSDAGFTGDGYRRRELVTRVQLRNFHLKKGI